MHCGPAPTLRPQQARACPCEAVREHALAADPRHRCCSPRRWDCVPTMALARALNVKGLINIQFAVKGEEIYVLEANPRASRTVPFVAKAVGAPIAAIAAKVMAGRPLTDFDLRHANPRRIAIKEAVFPFARFPGVDPQLGPEMRSTGEEPARRRHPAAGRGRRVHLGARQ